MLARTFRKNLVTPLQRNAWAPALRRAVTTDAASSHAEKEDVPEVSYTASIDTLFIFADFHALVERR